MVSELITKGVTSEVEITLNKFFEFFTAHTSLEASGNSTVVVYRRTLDFDFIDYLVFTAQNISDGNGAQCSLDIGGTNKYTDTGLNDDEYIYEEIDCTSITGDNEVVIIYGDNSAIEGNLKNISLYKYDEAT